MSSPGIPAPTWPHEQVGAPPNGWLPPAIPMEDIGCPRLIASGPVCWCDADTETCMEHAEVLGTLTEFIREKVLDSAGVEVDPHTPLLERGILNSLSTSALVVFINERLGVDVPAERMVGRNFRDLDSITRLVLELAADAREPEMGAL